MALIKKLLKSVLNNNKHDCTRHFCEAKKFDLSCVDIFRNIPPPELKSKEMYPKWLFNITKRGKSLQKLLKTDFDSLKTKEQKLLFKLGRKKKIKFNNKLDEKRLLPHRMKPLIIPENT